VIDEKQEGLIPVESVLNEKREIIIPSAPAKTPVLTGGSSPGSVTVPNTQGEKPQLSPHTVDYTVTDGLSDGLSTPTTTTTIRRYEDLSRAEAEKLLLDLNLKRGLIVGELGLTTSPRDVVIWTALPVPTVPSADLEVELSMTYSKTVHELRKLGVKKANGSGGAKGISVAGNYNKSRETLSQSETMTAHVLGTYNVPKIELHVQQERMEVSPEFDEAVRSAVSGGDTMKEYSGLLDVLGHYGHYVSTTFVLGGQMFAEDHKHVTGLSDAASFEQSFGGAFEADVVIKGVPVKAGGGYGQTDTKQQSNARQDAARTIRRQVRGGNAALIASASDWIVSLGSTELWRVIEHRELTPTVSLLSSDLREKCIYLINRYSLNDNARRRSPLDMREYADKLNAAAVDDFS
jgi:hypothetical protein